MKNFMNMLLLSIPPHGQKIRFAPSPVPVMIVAFALITLVRLCYRIQLKSHISKAHHTAAAAAALGISSSSGHQQHSSHSSVDLFLSVKMPSNGQQVSTYVRFFMFSHFNEVFYDFVVPVALIVEEMKLTRTSHPLVRVAVAHGKFISGAKVITAVPNISQPKVPFKFLVLSDCVE